jgi:hypothetical protein
VNFKTQIDKFTHFLTVFCHEIGYATAQVHHSKRIAAFFYKLYSLRIGLGIICPNKCSYNEGLARQIADAVDPKSTPAILASFKQKKRNER